MTKTAKKLVNFRVDGDVLAAFDKWAEGQGWSRTRALERCMQTSAGLIKSAPAPEKAKAEADEKCMHPISRRIDGQCAVCFEKVGGKK